MFCSKDVSRGRTVYAKKPGIQVDSTGQNSILLHDGANGRLTPDFVTAVLDQFSAGDTVLLLNDLPDNYDE